jgi:hypothetical protein
MPRTHKKENLKHQEKNTNILCKNRLIRIVQDLSAETLKAMKVWNDSSESDCQPRLLYPAKLSRK